MATRITGQRSGQHLARVSVAVVLTAALHTSHTVSAFAQKQVEESEKSQIEALRSEFDKFFLTERYVEAEPIARQILEAIERTFGRDDLETAEAANNLAITFSDPDRFGEAERLLRRALAIRERTQPKNHPDIALSLFNLANLLVRTERSEEAASMFRRAMAIYEQTDPRNDAEVASVLANLAAALQNLGRFEEAEEAHRRALGIREHASPENPLDLTHSLTGLGILLKSINRPDEAERLLRRALEIYEREIPSDGLGIATALNNLATALQDLNRLDEAERLFRRSLSIRERRLSINHRDIAQSLVNLSGPLQLLGRLREAEEFLRRSLAIYEAASPQPTLDIAWCLDNLGETLRLQNRLEEAESLFNRALGIREQTLPANHTSIAGTLNNLAVTLHGLNRVEEAERLNWRALVIQEQAIAPREVELGRILNNRAELMRTLNRLSEAESLHRRALAIWEQVLPENHPDIGNALGNLAYVLSNLSRDDEAVPLLRRALSIAEKSLSKNHPDIARSLANLAATLAALGRFEEAEQLQRRALTIQEAVLPGKHPHIATSLDNIGWALTSQGLYKEAEDYLRRALVIREEVLPANHLDIGTSFHNLATVFFLSSRFEEAEEFFRSALAARQQGLPQNHPLVAQSAENLAFILGARYALVGKAPPTHVYEESMALLDRAEAIHFARENRNSSIPFYALSDHWRTIADTRATNARAAFSAAARINSLDETEFRKLRERLRMAFLELQQERAGGAGRALASAAARAQTDFAVASLTRRRDTLLLEIKKLDDAFLAASSNTELSRDVRARRLADLRSAAEEVRMGLTTLDTEIMRSFPAYAELSEGLPLAVDDMLPMLAADEVLLSITPYLATGFFYAYAADGGNFFRLPHAGEAAALATRLRCSAAGRLDRSCGGAAQEAEIAAASGSDPARGATPVGLDPAAGAFDLALAHDLYNRLFPEEVREFLKGKKLIIAPAPELMGLPWHLLLTEPPPAGWDAPGTDRAKVYREAKWLFRNHPSITVLPTVASLRALRGPASERVKAVADRAFLGLGDALTGSAAERAAPPMECGKTILAGLDPQSFAPRSAGDAPERLFAGQRDAEGFALADPEAVRRQPRLADSRCELLAVADSLGGADAPGIKLLLGADASEAKLRDLDASGELARYRVLHFGVHGSVSGQLGIGEPALILTPPDQASARDDGVLTASEISTLTLAAEWVVLSACNTAAGTSADAEALTGLAKSFFYAGARSLLVSSWPVYSPAAVAITTGAFAAMARNPGIGRAEALNLAMGAALDSATNEFTAHPAYWAPFFLVGEGAR